MSTCPKDIKKQTNQNEIRVTWDYPVFEDNFDKPPVQLRITSNRNPGAIFPWGRYQVLYEASDRAGNKATCEFFVEVGRKLKVLYDVYHFENHFFTSQLSSQDCYFLIAGFHMTSLKFKL